MTPTRSDAPEHKYRIVEFQELPPVLMGPDNYCTCTCATPCPLRKTGSQLRCSLEELQRIDREAQVRRGYQSGGDY